VTPLARSDLLVKVDILLLIVAIVAMIVFIISSHG
jgi:hypothetical protein